MKKLSLLSFLLLFSLVFALVDTDRDGVSDDRDICPRVYARSETGCPRLVSVETSTITPNACINQKMQEGYIWAYFTPLCTDDAQCPTIAQVRGVQLCDPLVPLVLDSNRTPLVRGPVFVVGF